MLDFQAGPILYRGKWDREGTPERSDELRQYAPVGGSQHFVVDLNFLPPQKKLSEPRFELESPKNWRVWQEQEEFILQVWSGISEDWAIEARVKNDYSALSLCARADHPQKNHLEFLIATALRWVTAHKIAEKGGVLLHGALIHSKDTGGTFIATGPSGAGKSTISSFFRGQESFDVFTDETLIALPQGERWFGYGTPWSGMLSVARNDCGPLLALYFLAKAGEHSLRDMSLEEAYLRAVKEVFLPPWKEAATSRALENLFQLLASVPRQVFSFSKSHTVVDFMKRRMEI